MEEQTDKFLVAQFPELFSNPSCQWCECSDGWKDLIYSMCCKIDLALDAGLIKSFSFSQIKEKFATLRVYYYYTANDDVSKFCYLWYNLKFYLKYPKRLWWKIKYPVNQCWLNDPAFLVIEDAVTEAGVKSKKVCEVCGKPGKVNKTGYWLYTECPACYLKRISKQTNK